MFGIFQSGVMRNCGASERVCGGTKLTEVSSIIGTVSPPGNEEPKRKVSLTLLGPRLTRDTVIGTADLIRENGLRIADFGRVIGIVGSSVFKV